MLWRIRRKVNEFNKQQRMCFRKIETGFKNNWNNNEWKMQGGKKAEWNWRLFHFSFSSFCHPPLTQNKCMGASNLIHIIVRNRCYRSYALTKIVYKTFTVSCLYAENKMFTVFFSLTHLFSVSFEHKEALIREAKKKTKNKQKNWPNQNEGIH